MDVAKHVALAGPLWDNAGVHGTVNEVQHYVMVVRGTGIHTYSRLDSYRRDAGMICPSAKLLLSLTSLNIKIVFCARKAFRGFFFGG